jgi:hypothetical protein
VDSKDNKHGNLCDKSNDGIHPSVHYKCGIPTIGSVAFGISNLQQQDSASGFTPGWCTVHVAQHQRNQYGAKKVVGSTQKHGIDGASKSLSVASYLPNALEVIAKGGDFDPVVFKYGGMTWDSNDKAHQSTLGSGPRHGYEGGNREGDMGFSC